MKNDGCRKKDLDIMTLPKTNLYESDFGGKFSKF